MVLRCSLEYTVLGLIPRMIRTDIDVTTYVGYLTLRHLMGPGQRSRARLDTVGLVEGGRSAVIPWHAEHLARICCNA